MAYVLGFWFADGWMTQPDKDACICFVSKDREHLELIRNDMQSEHLIHSQSAKEKGGFTITTAQGKITDVGKKYCRTLQRADGYGYSQQCAPAGTFLSSLSLKA
jgi:hypothetical protein